MIEIIIDVIEYLWMAPRTMHDSSTAFRRCPANENHEWIGTCITSTCMASEEVHTKEGSTEILCKKFVP